MIIKTLYIIQQPNGVITQYRLIADKNMILKKDNVLTYCIDTDSTEGWEEAIDTSEKPESFMEVELNERNENS